MTLESNLRAAVERIRNAGFAHTQAITRNALRPVDEDGDGFWEPSRDLGAGEEPGDYTVRIINDDGVHIATVNEEQFVDLKTPEEVFERLLFFAEHWTIHDLEEPTD